MSQPYLSKLINCYHARPDVHVSWHWYALHLISAWDDAPPGCVNELKSAGLIKDTTQLSHNSPDDKLLDAKGDPDKSSTVTKSYPFLNPLNNYYQTWWVILRMK